MVKGREGGLFRDGDERAVSQSGGGANGPRSGCCRAPRGPGRSSGGPSCGGGRTSNRARRGPASGGGTRGNGEGGGTSPHASEPRVSSSAWLPGADFRFEATPGRVGPGAQETNDHRRGAGPPFPSPVRWTPSGTHPRVAPKAFGKRSFENGGGSRRVARSRTFGERTGKEAKNEAEGKVKKPAEEDAETFPIGRDSSCFACSLYRPWPVRLHHLFFLRTSLFRLPVLPSYFLFSSASSSPSFFRPSQSSWAVGASRLTGGFTDVKYLRSPDANRS